VQQDHVADQIGVGLLPEWLFALAPDGRDDGRDVECLGVGIERIVQRVITDVPIERDLYVVVLASAPFQDALKLPESFRSGSSAQYAKSWRMAGRINP
jgi:hypothetical protein